jgi:hypothetical protein
VFRNDSTTPKTPEEEETSPKESERSPKESEEVGERGE